MWLPYYHHHYHYHCCYYHYHCFHYHHCCYYRDPFCMMIGMMRCPYSRFRRVAANS